MTYEEALRYIHSTLQFGSRPGLARISGLLERMGNPQKKLRFIHIAGTNGKGSVCRAIQQALTASGYRTGLYTSPYVIDFCERIQIDGEEITHEDLARAVEEIRPYVDSTADGLEHPTEFEIITALAFSYFLKQGCDAVVLEVGLGGRFDATNVIGCPLASVIASVSYDHTNILGKTLDKIAFEKCGIIKQGGRTVSSPGQQPEALEVIRKTCLERSNRLVIPDMEKAEILKESIRGTRIRYKGSEFLIPLCGRHQIGNFLTAYEVLRLLDGQEGFEIPENRIQEGFRGVTMPARVEILKESPLVLLDGGHNPSAAAALGEILDRFLKGRRIAAVMGIFKDKDYENVIRQLAPRFCSVTAVRPENPRALDPVKVVEIAERYCPDAVSMSDYGEAYRRAVGAAGPDGVVLICGSFYLAGPMRRLVLDTTKNDEKVFWKST